MKELYQKITCQKKNKKNHIFLILTQKIYINIDINIIMHNTHDKYLFYIKNYYIHIIL